jgi:hypothetical protein
MFIPWPGRLEARMHATFPIAQGSRANPPGCGLGVVSLNDVMMVPSGMIISAQRKRFVRLLGSGR